MHTEDSRIGLGILLSGTFIILLVTGILYKIYWVKKKYKPQLVVENLRYTRNIHLNVICADLYEFSADKVQAEYHQDKGDNENDNPPEIHESEIHAPEKFQF